MSRWKIKLNPFAIVLIIAAATLAAVGTGIVLNNIINKSSELKVTDPAFPDDVYGISVITALMPENLPARTCIVRNVEYIVIHETGNTTPGADAAKHSEYLMSGNSGETSWHYTVDDHEIYHNVPDNEIAWHAGDTKNPDGGNAHGIGIELCVNSDGDFEKTLDNAERLAAYLMKQYNLSISAVTQHANYIEKNCPETLRDTGRWDEFTAKVQKYYDEHKND